MLNRRIPVVEILRRAGARNSIVTKTEVKSLSSYASNPYLQYSSPHRKQKTQTNDTTGTPNFYQSPVTAHHNKIYHKIKNIPVGSMEMKDWHDAKHALFDFTRRQHDARTATLLLDRLYEEQCHNPVLDKNFIYTAQHYAMILDTLAKSKLHNKAALADQLFDAAQARYNLHPSHQPQPDNSMYNALLHCHANSTDANATTRAEAILAQMLQQQTTNPTIFPDLWTYNMVCLAHANRKGEYGSAKKAEDWLLHMASSGNNLQPDAITFNTVLKAWKNSGERKGPDRAMEILQSMIKLYGDGTSTAQPDEVSFNTVLHAYAEQGRGQEAMDALLYIKSVVKEYQLWVDLTTVYNAVLYAWDKSTAQDAGTQAQIVLETMFIDSRDVGLIVKPNELAVYNTLSAHCKAGNPQMAQDLLYRLIESYQLGKHAIVPTTNLFNCVVRAWIKSDKAGGGTERAKHMVHYMMELAGDPSFTTWPDAATFNLLIDGYNASPPGKENVHHIVEIIAKMEECYDAGYRQCQPTSFSYLCLLNSILKAPPSNALAQVAVETLQRLETNYYSKTINTDRTIKPDVTTYNMVIHALSRVADTYSKEQVFNIIRSIESKYHDGHKDLEPGNTTYTMVFKTFMANPNNAEILKVVKLYESLERISARVDRPFQLNGFTVQTFLVVLKNARTVRCAYRAEKVLDSLNLNDFDHQLASDMIACVILSFVRAVDGKHENHAGKLLLKYIDKYDNGDIKMFPSPQAFTAVIDYLGKGPSTIGNVNTMDLAKTIYNHATRLFPSKEFGDRGHYAMMRLLTVRGCGKESSNLLFHLIEGGYTDLGKDLLVFNGVLHAYANQANKTKEAAIEARAFFDRIMATPGAPKADLRLYNTMMSAAIISPYASSEDKQVAWGIVEQTMNELEASTTIQPDHVSYGILARCHRYLLPQGDEQYSKIRDLFLKGRARGIVGPSLLAEANQLPKEYKQDLFGEVNVETLDQSKFRESVPEEWTKGIPSNRYRDIH